MNILIVSTRYAKAKIIESDFIPRIGDNIDMFYKPSPAVTRVLLFPSDETLKSLDINTLDLIFKAIIFCE